METRLINRPVVSSHDCLLAISGGCHVQGHMQFRLV